MKINFILIIGWIVMLAMALNPGVAFSELKSLDDAELSSVEAEGATADAVNNSNDAAENSGILSVGAGESDLFDLNDPNRETNAFRPTAVNNNTIAAPQNQFNNLNPAPACSSGRSCCP